ncbi:MAG TPA: YggS family pyridoxal phosphate-dependent enzyme [Candidatus Acidoferrales bacterium]|nr:YggS family pyridoxal phosphate-dependent enzyme [Candidatus Acidoferrales bacterium]
MAVDTNSVAANLERVTQRIQRAAKRAGRREDDITIVAVSKGFPTETIRAAYDTGLRHFGENRIQEFEAKHETLVGFSDLIWHFIGHLQSNKANRAVHLFDRIDSVDSISLAHKLDVAATTEAKMLGVLIEVRLSDEETKSGAREGALSALAASIQELPRLQLRGLMAIPPYSDDPENARFYFRRLRELRDGLCAQLGLPLPVLSMGMSTDFEIAIEEGANEVRVGTALFGERAQAKP